MSDPIKLPNGFTLWTTKPVPSQWGGTVAELVHFAVAADLEAAGYVPVGALQFAETQRDAAKMSLEEQESKTIAIERELAEATQTVAARDAYIKKLYPISIEAAGLIDGREAEFPALAKAVEGLIGPPGDNE